MQADARFCPGCGEADKLEVINLENGPDKGTSHIWCNRCLAYVATWTEKDRRFEFPGTPIKKGRKKAGKKAK